MEYQHFHIGIRVDEIVTIAHNSSDKYPTKYHLRSGVVINTTGEWESNVKIVNNILNHNERVRREVTKGLDQLKRDVDFHELTLSRIKSAIDLFRRQSGVDGDIADIVAWVQEDKQYMTKPMREKLARILGVSE